MNIKTKCCFCGKELDINNSEIPATWYGRYNGEQLVDVVCADCVKNKKEEWKIKK